MIVNMNGNFWFDTDLKGSVTGSPDQLVVSKSGNKKLKRIAITLWTLSGSFFAKAAMAATNSGSFYQQMQPLYHVFQDMALGLGGLSLLCGLVLMVVKRRWGTMTLKTTAIIVAGVFLVPSGLMLLAIIGTMLNDSLWQAFNNIRDAQAVMGK